MERGKGGIAGWSAGSFRSQQPGPEQTAGTQSPALLRAPDRQLETFAPHDGSGRFSGPSGGLSGASYDVVIAPGCTVQGKLELKGRALVNARVEGELSNDVELVVGEQGAIEGNLTGSSVRVFGRVKGDISCSGRLELRSGAVVTGNLASPALVIEDGVVFEGHCRMWDAQSAAGSASGGQTRSEDDEDFEDEDGAV